MHFTMFFHIIKDGIILYFTVIEILDKINAKLIYGYRRFFKLSSDERKVHIW